MAMRRRRNYSKRAAKALGHSFWLRPPAFSLTLRQAAAGVFSDVILTESDFMDPSIGLNDTKKVAPVLERIVTDVGFDQTVNGNYFAPAGFGQVTMLVEAMLFTQADQFLTTVQSSLDFDQVLANNRILGYAVMEWNMDGYSVTSSLSTVRCRKHFEPKSRVRLREQAVGVAIRTNFDIANAASEANFPWVQPTMLVRVP